MSRSSPTISPPETASPYGSADHDCVIGMNWINVPGLGKLSVWVDEKGNTSSVTIYNSTVTKKKTYTPTKNTHWVGLEIKTDNYGDEE